MNTKAKSILPKKKTQSDTHQNENKHNLQSNRTQSSPVKPERYQIPVRSF